MKLFRFVIASLLALVLVLSPALSYANSATTTLPAGFQMPSVGDIAKRIGSRSNAVVVAVEGLLGAVDWVLDPENNRVKYKIPVNQVDNAEAVAYCQRLAKSANRTYGYLRENKGKGYVYFDCMNPYMNQYGIYYPNMERTLSNEQIAEQIIKNAKAGHADSVDFVVEVANEIALLSKGGKQNVDNEYVNMIKNKQNGDKDPCQWLRELYKSTKDTKERGKIRIAMKRYDCDGKGRFQ